MFSRSGASHAPLPIDTLQLQPEAGDIAAGAPCALARAGTHCDLQAIHALCDELKPPEGACKLWRKFYTRLHPLILDLTENIAVEEILLYPMLNELLAHPTEDKRPR